MLAGLTSPLPASVCFTAKHPGYLSVSDEFIDVPGEGVGVGGIVTGFGRTPGVRAGSNRRPQNWRRAIQADTRGP